MTLFTTIFGDPNLKEIKKLQPLVEATNALEPELEQLEDVELKERWATLRASIQDKPSDEQPALLDAALPEAFAIVREAAKRVLGLRHYDVQLIGGITLHQGKIAEMRTGEGKTLVATLPLALNALTGRGVHLVTPNDYLSRVGAHWMGPVYAFLGLSVAAIGQQGSSWKYVPVKTVELGIKNNELGDQPTDATNDPESLNLPAGQAGQEAKSSESAAADSDWPNLQPCTRAEAYATDITYGTNNEFGFDYLRDNMVVDSAHLVQSRRSNRSNNEVGKPIEASARDLVFAIVDEVDSILIDEARTPLIISGQGEDSADLYAKFATFVNNLSVGEDYTVDEKERYVAITDAGIKKMEVSLGVDNIYDAKTVAYVHHLEEALKAKALFTLDKDYVVKEGEVIIVDEFTGRLMNGRRYSEGLHQAIEAKEGVTVRQEQRTLATITFQNLFRMYGKLAGMTGTAETEAEEFSKIYKLEVLVIPTHRDIQRSDHTDVIYKTEAAKFEAIVADVKQKVANGQPVLVGTASISKSELISKAFKQAGIQHDVLNAKQHEREAKIILHAGEPARVTVATNMAGRGVDIVLGGAKPDESDSKAAFLNWEAAHSAVTEAGGLAVVGTERHEARRIDNQLRGRSGRQGDPGTSQFYISMEDDLMRIFGGERLKNVMDRLGLPDDEPIQNTMISGSIEQAQRRVEGHNFDIRKHLVEYDDVMNQHREVIYRKRKKILELNSDETWLHDEIKDLLHDEELEAFQKKVNEVGEENFRRVERVVYLRTVDTLWMEHLNTMQHLREGIGLKGYAQKDPLVEYKDAAFGLFQTLKDDIENQVVEILLKLNVEKQPAPVVLEEPSENLKLQGADEAAAGFEAVNKEVGIMNNGTSENPPQSSAAKGGGNETPLFRKEGQGEILGDDAGSSKIKNQKSNVQVTVRGPGAQYAQANQPTQAAANPYPGVGRNDPCPCGATKPDGSPKKFKHCHGK